MRNLMKQTSATAQPKAVKMQKNQMAMLFFWLMLGSISLLVLAKNVHAADENVGNLYEKTYKAQNQQNLKSLAENPDTKMYVGKNQAEDNISMLESGFDLMGTSGFTAKEVAPDLALSFGKSIKADQVLVYAKEAKKPKKSRMEFIKEKAKKGGEIEEKDLIEERSFEYYASYWAKLPMPLFGVHLIKLNQVSQDPETDEIKKVAEKGLKIIAVIQGSPAAQAGILRSDSLLKMGDAEMNKADDLFAAVKKYQGQTVPVLVKRGEEEITMQVALGSRK
jgi:membrane-associated protease RseP (regulator of RpoE activity)